MSSLAAQLDDLKTNSEHFIRRALGAANFLGGETNLNRIVAVASNSSLSQSMRVEALEMLGQWANPVSRDRVVGAWREIGERSAAEAIAALEPVFEATINDELVRDAAIQTAKSLNLKSAEKPLQRLFANEATNEETRMKVLSLIHI